MDYKNALDNLFSLVNYEHISGTSRKKMKLDLNRMNSLMDNLGNPHLGTPTVHIAGTKGKGSTAAMVTSVLSKQGYVTGMYTSPHLHTFLERISLNGISVTRTEFADLFSKIWDYICSKNLSNNRSEITFFEALTAMAFLCFRSRGVDFQVLEVGMGGRLDATNIVNRKVCGITPVSLDHTGVLGNDLVSVAKEKAGIVKPGCVVVAAPQEPEVRIVIDKVCSRAHAKLIVVGEDINHSVPTVNDGGQSFVVQGRFDDYHLWTPLFGDYQIENACTAIGIIEVLREKGWVISHKAIVEGFRDVSWPCRMEILTRNPLIVVDGAHNPAAIRRLCQSLSGYFKYRRLILIFGASLDKDISAMTDELLHLEPLVFTVQSGHPRAASAPDLETLFNARGLKACSVSTISEALKLATEEFSPGDLILVAGSLFVAAAVRSIVLEIEEEVYPAFSGVQKKSI